MTGRANRPALGRRASVLIIGSGVLVTLVTVALARLSFGLILPAMRESLGLSYAQAGHLGTATALGYLALVMAAGALAARRGGRLSILLGLVFVAVGFVGLSLATGYVQLLALMTLLGFGTAFAYTPLISLIGAWFATRRGMAIGLINSGVGMGLMGAGWIVPAITSAHENGWRWVWALFAAVAVVAMFAAVAWLRDPPRAVSTTRETGSDAQARRAARAAVFRNPYVVVVGLAYGIIGLTYIVQAIFMFSFALAAGVEPVLAGNLAAIMGLLGIVCGPIWGTISDRLGRGRSLGLAMLLAAVATLVPVVWPVTLGFVVHYIVLGVTVTGMFTSALAASTERVSSAQAPLAVSYVTLFFATGQLVGPAAAGWLIGATDDFRWAFGVSAGLLAIGVMLAATLTRLGARGKMDASPAG